ncbi:MAG: cob(I)yrinic acid a,c-diamide adenosyltransferase [Endomicrobium sp.]|jgi:cob(I)alamin adenosyltransferase|nr:cob(I)yrinic acid a,c-diamide adenosyltransferase [Endomicrobium sp.]
MLILNIGDGKGKTTASIGQIIRSLGHGFKVCLIQLFKNNNFYGEQNILLKLENLDFFSFVKKHPYYLRGISSEELANLCDSAMRKLRELTIVDSKKYDLIVLDEFNVALRDKLINENEFVALIEKLSWESNVVVTGRGSPQALIDMADLVTEMKEIKHPYKNGVRAQKGIEY